MERAAELKTKQQELSKVTVENEDCTSETIDQAQETLAAVKKYQSYASAQHRAHVPKFGCWDRDNVRYTTYFESARIAKAAEKMNPDDPEALVNGLEDLNSIHDLFDLNLNKKKSMDVEGNINLQGRNRHNRQKGIQDTEKQHPGEGNNTPRWKNTRNFQRSGSSKSIASESGSDQSDSSYLLQLSSQSQKRYRKSNGNKGSDEGRNSFSRWAHRLSLSRPRRSGSESNPKGASIPKFGDWDERDPSSGNGFTTIFEKVKEEKQIIASGEVQVVPYSDLDKQTRNKPSYYKSMMFCCLSPSRSG